LIPVSLTPTLLGMTGSLYFIGALLLSLAYAGVSGWMARRPAGFSAKWLFFTSIVYLPALLAIMMADRLPS
jgi:protoheme IX farnesyltransferase